MPDIDTVRTWQGRTMLDRDGSRIGSIDAIYLDDQTGQPEWALVNTGLFGTKATFVPLAQAFQSDNDVLVPYNKQLVKDAPRVDPGRSLTVFFLRPRSSSCGATTAWTTTPPTALSPRAGMRPAAPRWDATPRGRPLMTP
jgi:hypothetical protein